ncbi:MAG TPA: lysylphosphatidylglycerol synthase transmembrane domain-containing protein [Planctomycetota bacterium]|nr:lysylphosphatidylglycerol synthase transmembrane domain-containing protein [Planctomycetota bacterium]
MKRFLGPAAGLVLVGVALWIVGFEDRVVDAAGTTHRGRLVEAGGAAVVLRTDAGDLAFEPGEIRSVRAGLLSAFRPLASNPALALLGVGAHLLAILAVHVRWGVLLRAAGLETPWLAVFRLGWIGQFAASVLPGGIATGDVVKALYVAGGTSGRKAHAVTTVAFDRLLGLIVLCTIALAGALLAPGATRVGATRTLLATLLGGCLVLLALLVSPRVRALTGLTRLVPRRLSAIAREAGEALALYGGKGRALLAASLVAALSQGFILLAILLYGKALGATLSLFAILAAVPVAQMVSAVPGLPGGFGVGDLAYVAILPDAGVKAGTALALSFTYKIIHLLIALPAGLWLRRTRP